MGYQETATGVAEVVANLPHFTNTEHAFEDTLLLYSVIAYLGSPEFDPHLELIARLLKEVESEISFAGYPIDLELCVASRASDDEIVQDTLEHALKELRIKIVAGTTAEFAPNTSKIILYKVIGCLFDFKKNCWVMRLHMVPTNADLPAGSPQH